MHPIPPRNGPFFLLSPASTPPAALNVHSQSALSDAAPTPARRALVLQNQAQVWPLCVGPRDPRDPRLRCSAGTNRPLCGAGCDWFPSPDTRFLLSRGSCAASGGAVTMAVLCCGGWWGLEDAWLWGGGGGQASTAETQEDGPRNAPQQLLLLTNGNLRSWGR